MFKKSDKHSQLDMFSSPTEHFREAKRKDYLKNDSWHNRFRTHVVMRVDESVFKVLYSSGTGAPNASVRVLVGMMILKEGQGWSDEQLFENCSYNLLVRSALGLMSLEDAEPAPSTYYLFRRKLVDYACEHGEDLFEKCQIEITRSQVLEFNVSGKQVRMDSKLIGSNIAWYSRYELVHETLRLFITEREEFIHKRNLSQTEFALIDSVLGETGNKVVYRSTKEELDARFLALGKLMYRLVTLFKSYPYGRYQTLKTVFEEQFRIDEHKTLLPVENKDISAKSIQSPHDTECHYRNKDGNKVKGYSVNVTETCDPTSEDHPEVLNLITNTQVEPVSAPDNGFLEKALAGSQAVLSDKIEKVHADGAYNSQENREFCSENSMDLLLTAMQGAAPRYEVELDQNHPETLLVTDTVTGEIIKAKKVKSRKNTTEKRWSIKITKGEYRHFDMESVRTSALRRKLRDVPIEEGIIRNNVEAAIFQLGYHYPNDKSRYRGLAKHKLWACSRSLWINLVRIVNYVTRISQRPLFGQKLPEYIFNLCFNMWIIVSAYLINKNTRDYHGNLYFSAN